ncbi:MAG: hypothetical protein ACKVQU_34275 [Burkholderiales bacterium]
MSDTRWVLLPVGQQANGRWIDDVLRDRVAEGALAGRRTFATDVPRGRVEVFRGHALDEAINARFYSRGWTDGLPIVVPTIGRVEETIRFSPEPAQHAIAEIDPMAGVATIEKIAINAVMAGCRPAYFPVVLAATRALIDPTFNLRGVQTTDENVTPLVIVSGPIAAELEINSGLGVLGPGWQANASIGRAIRLIMQNLGGGWPGIVSLAGVGQPGRYTMCVAENHAASPWPALHSEAGLAARDSAVTLMRAEACVNVTGGLDDLANVMGSALSAFSLLHGGRVAVLIAPHTARQLAARGLDKVAVARYLFEHARVRTEDWERLWIRNEIAASYGIPAWVEEAIPTGRIPVVERAEDIVIFVAGGEASIAQQVYFPTWGFPSCRITQRIELPAHWRTGG